MKEWKFWKCFRAFNTVHGKLLPVRLSPTLSLALPNLGGFAVGQSSVGQFHVQGNFPIMMAVLQGHNLNSAFQTKISSTSSVE